MRFGLQIETDFPIDRYWALSAGVFLIRAVPADLLDKKLAAVRSDRAACVPGGRIALARWVMFRGLSSCWPC